MEYGFHRALEPVGVVPQAAWRVDSRPELLRPTEVLIDVSRIIALDAKRKRLERMAALGFADLTIQADATRSESVLEQVMAATSGALCDLALNCVNLPDTEATSILCARQQGTVVFYSMATRFDKAALGTDATDNDVRLVIGNGIAEGQAELALDLFRTNPDLLGYFNECMAAG